MYFFHSTLFFGIYINTNLIPILSANPEIRHDNEHLKNRNTQDSDYNKENLLYFIKYSYYYEFYNKVNYDITLYEKVDEKLYEQENRIEELYKNEKIRIFPHFISLAMILEQNLKSLLKNYKNKVQKDSECVKVEFLKNLFAFIFLIRNCYRNEPFCSQYKDLSAVRMQISDFKTFIYRKILKNIDLKELSELSIEKIRTNPTNNEERKRKDLFYEACYKNVTRDIFSNFEFAYYKFNSVNFTYENKHANNQENEESIINNKNLIITENKANEMKADDKNDLNEKGINKEQDCYSFEIVDEINLELNDKISSQMIENIFYLQLDEFKNIIKETFEFIYVIHELIEVKEILSSVEEIKWEYNEENMQKNFYLEYRNIALNTFRTILIFDKFRNMEFVFEYIDLQSVFLKILLDCFEYFYEADEILTKKIDESINVHKEYTMQEIKHKKLKDFIDRIGYISMFYYVLSKYIRDFICEKYNIGWTEHYINFFRTLFENRVTLISSNDCQKEINQFHINLAEELKNKILYFLIYNLGRDKKFVVEFKEFMNSITRI